MVGCKVTLGKLVAYHQGRKSKEKSRDSNKGAECEQGEHLSATKSNTQRTRPHPAECEPQKV
jgi:hypothetical protein